PVAAIAKEKVDAKAHRAKGSAKDLLYIGGEPLRLPPSDSRLQWFQKLRDEAHRFALSYHRKKRLEKEKQISLLEVKGIGPARIKRLLDYFGSFEAIRKADRESLAKAIGDRAAKTLFDHLHGITEIKRK
ncbi:MAG: excinuclease ABC subunit C, partial [Epsilonproteobacteria bacterium]|nr:excinuclease ABC subunit C [Campylobacterota bacterium]